MGKAIMFFSLFVFMFLTARIVSFLGRGRWSPFAKTTVQQDLYRYSVGSHIAFLLEITVNDK